jgi:hypothetical protein
VCVCVCVCVRTLLKCSFTHSMNSETNLLFSVRCRICATMRAFTLYTIMARNVLCSRYKNLYSCVASKVKLPLCLTKHHAMKTHWGNGGIAIRILKLDTRWKSLYPRGKNSGTHWIGGWVPPGPIWTRWQSEKLRSMPLPGINTGRPDHSLVSILTELPLLYKYIKYSYKTDYVSLARV